MKKISPSLLLEEGIIHTKEAIKMPAGMPRTMFSIALMCATWVAMASKATLTSGLSKWALSKKAAAIAVPIKLEAKTMPHKRPTCPSFCQVNGRNKGTTVVMVFSVNSCMWPKMTMMKPTV